MIFESKLEGRTNWGCPRLSDHGAGWLVDWYDAFGKSTGASIARGEALAWINANPEEVARMQAEVREWLKSLNA